MASAMKPDRRERFRQTPGRAAESPVPGRAAESPVPGRANKTPDQTDAPVLRRSGRATTKTKEPRS